jgi:hypothetical protein
MTDTSQDQKKVVLNEMFETLSNACNSNPSKFISLTNIFIGNSQAWYFRGRAYLYMQEYKRALYDFSMAIAAEYNNNYVQDPIKENL